MAIQQYSIGRGDECRIRIQDSSQRVSRNHATLKVLDNGKMFITDHSSNGTFVNGIKISPNVDFPVKRADSISLANVTELNWALIPKKSNKILLYSIIAVVVLAAVVVVGAILLNRPDRPTSPSPIETQCPDTTSTYKKEQEATQKKVTEEQATEKQKAEKQTPSKSKEAKKPKQEEPQKPDTTKTRKVTPEKQVF